MAEPPRFRRSIALGLRLLDVATIAFGAVTSGVGAATACANSDDSNQATVSIHAERRKRFLGGLKQLAGESPAK
jgi:hypothetical protein